MAENRPTIFQRVGSALFGSSLPPEVIKTSTTAGTTATNRVLYTTKDKEEYERKLLQYKQQKALSYQWVKAGIDNSLESLASYNAVKLMYRDADLMDATPEIGSALDIYAEEACNFNSDGQMLHVSSKSKRIKGILENLFYKNLKIHITLPMIARAMCKYGNQFMLLNIVKGQGVLGWKQLPVYEMDRLENGYPSMYAGIVPNQTNELNPDETKFVWVGHNNETPYRDWMVAHFRLLKDSIFLPYGVSILHKARRAWRMWSMMEDAMLIYRLDKSVERRIYKVYVGAIDNQDVPAYLQQIADGFKRTPVIDPETGQIDLRKNFLAVDQDVFIPVRSSDEPTSIEAMPSAQNPTSMDDINYEQNKVLTALRIPKPYLNFQEAQGKGQNMSLTDIRFCRMVNTIQQFLLLELTKVAMCHLYFLGYTDDLSNFTLSMNNPSAQIEALELEDLTKRIQTATAALTDPGIGMPLMSLHQVLKKIMKMSDSEIKDMLNEIRLEKAMAAELEQTANVIKRTGMFDTTDRVYGDYNAMHGGAQQQQEQEQGNDMGSGGGLGGGDLMDGGSLNMDSLGSAGSEDMGDMSGSESDVDMGSAPDMDNGTPMESTKSNKPLLNEVKTFTEQYFEMLEKSMKDSPDYVDDSDDFNEKNVILAETINNIFKKIDTIVEDVNTTNEENEPDVITEKEDVENDNFDEGFYNELETDDTEKTDS